MSGIQKLLLSLSWYYSKGTFDKNNNSLGTECKQFSSETFVNEKSIVIVTV